MSVIRPHSHTTIRPPRGRRGRTVEAIDLERQRIERDLHDGAQQRLVAVRIRLGLLAQRAERADQRAEIEQLGRDLDTALAEIRAVARGGAPAQLRRVGVEGCLRSAAARAPVAVSIDNDAFGRYPGDVERTVYFCCHEALQNALKHAGPRASVAIRLVGTATRVSFVVEDSGVGFDRRRVRPGLGLTVLEDRVAGMGGRLTIESRPGIGTRVHGVVPLGASSSRAAVR